MKFIGTSVRSRLLRVLLVFLAAGQIVHARPHRVEQVPNGSVFSCALCHTSASGGGPRNVLGQAIEAEFLSSLTDSGNVLWSKTLAERDSDGDAYTNGEELGDPTGSGTADPEAAVTNPGDAADFPMAAFVGASLDLNGDGAVDASDFDLFAPRFVTSLADTADTSIDFDGDTVLDSDDLALLLQNLGRSISDTTITLDPGAGPNVSVLPTLDFETGNGTIDGVLSGSVGGAATTFQLEVFLGDVEGDLSAVEIRFRVNSALVRVSGFSDTNASMVAHSDSSIVLADLNGVGLADNGYLGALSLTTVTDVTDVPVRVELVEIKLTDRATSLRNIRSAGGIGVTANPLDSVLPDLNGDGFVDDSDVVLFGDRFVLGVGRQDARFDETIDFDLDERLTEEDVLLFMLNFGRSQETFTFFRSSESGPNAAASVSLDFMAGNFENDGVTSGTISGDGEVFSFDIFASGIASDLAMVSLTFEVDFSEVSLFDYEPPLGMTLYGKTDSSAVFGVVSGQDVSDGYLGRADFIPASDLAGIPTPVTITRALVASADGILTDPLDASSAMVILNEVVDDLPATEVNLLAVELDSVELAEDTLVSLAEGAHTLSFVLNAPLLDAVDDSGDPAFAAGLPQFQNFKAFLLPDPFSLGGTLEARKSFDEESLVITLDVPVSATLQAIGSAVPEFSPQKSADFFLGSGPAGSVSGRVVFGTGLAERERKAGPPHVLLLQQDLAGLVDGLTSDVDILDALSSAWVRGDFLANDNTFELKFVPPGEYHLAGRLTVMIDGSPEVVSGAVAAPLSVADGEAITDVELFLDLPLEPIAVSGIVLAAIEFDGDNMFVEDAAGDLFEVLAGSARLTTTEGDVFDDVTLVTAGVTVTIEGLKLGPSQVRANTITADIQVASTGPQADFTGDGVVDFSDFLTFALGFGKTTADADFDARLDLDASGDVGFADFLIFVGEFGASGG